MIELADICSILSLIVLVAIMIIDRFASPNLKGEIIETTEDILSSTEEFSTKLDIVCTMADKFVALAKVTFSGEGKGEVKRDWVINHLKEICDNIDLELTEDELKAINEDAYNELKTWKQ